MSNIWLGNRKVYCVIKITLFNTNYTHYLIVSVRLSKKCNNCGDDHFTNDNIEN